MEGEDDQKKAMKQRTLTVKICVPPLQLQWLSLLHSTIYTILLPLTLPVAQRALRTSASIIQISLIFS